MITTRPAGRVVLFTGNGLRHRYVAEQLAGTLDLVGVVAEAKAQIVTNPEALASQDQRVIREHLDQRDAAEQALLGDVGPPGAAKKLCVEHGASNDPAVFAWTEALAPDFIVLYGSSIIEPPLLDKYGRRIVNIHLGLSPYYRGSATNFWPLVNRRPECVGATLHLAVSQVDAGPILAQVRPRAEVSDRAHELGTKTIIAAVALVPRVLAAVAEGRLQPKAQDLAGGQLCRRRDFCADAVRTMWRHFETDMMAEYLADAQARQAEFPLVELEEPRA